MSRNYLVKVTACILTTKALTTKVVNTEPLVVTTGHPIVLFDKGSVGSIEQKKDILVKNHYSSCLRHV